MTPLYTSAQLNENFRHLYWDIAAFGVLSGSTLYFQSVYAARLDASAIQLGLIAAGPAFIAMLATLPAGRWMEGKSLLKIIFQASIFQRMWYLAFIALPWLANGQMQVNSIILLSLLVTIPGTLLTIAFFASFPDMVPIQYRSEVVGKRNALLAISMMLTYIICGFLLDRLPNPLNYQIVFGLGAIGALVSTYHLSRVRTFVENLASNQPEGPLSPNNKHKSMLRLDLLAGRFGLFLLAYLGFYTFQYMPSPLFTLAFVKALHLTDGQIGLGNAMFYLTMTMGSLTLQRSSRRIGGRKLLVITVAGFGIYPLILGLVWQAWSFWFVSLAGGIIYGLASGAILNQLMERVPENDRPAHMTLHTLALNLGILAGSFLGPLAADLIGLREAMFAIGVLRITAGILMWLWA